MIKNDIVNYSKGWKNSDNKSHVKDSVYRGEVGKVLLGEAVNKNDLLYPVLTSLGTVKEWKQSNAASASTMPALAIALEDGADEAVIKVMFRGYIKDDDFNYGTLAAGTVVNSGTVHEGDRLVIDEDCFQMTVAKGTTSAAKIAATNSLTTTSVAVEGELLNIGGVIFEFRTDGVLTAGSDYEIDVSAALTQAVWEPALEAAIDNAVNAGDLDVTYVSFSSNVLVITLGDSYVGLEQNAVVSDASDVTNASFTQDTTFLGGCPKVNWWVVSDLSAAAVKIALTAQIVLAIASGLEITQAAWATNDLVLTSAKKGYAGNLIAMYETDTTGAKDAGEATTVSGALMTGGAEGGQLWADNAKGLMTLSPDGVVNQSVGFAIEADKFFFNPMPSDVLAAAPASYGAGLAGAATTYRMVDALGTIITEIHVDLAGLTVTGTAQGGAIGLAGIDACYLTKNDAAVNGVVFKVEMICVETPTEGTATFEQDVDLCETTAADVQAGEDVDVDIIAAARDWVAGEHAVNIVPKLVASDYLYLAAGDTAGDTGTYTNGQFIIRLFGHATI